MTNPVDIANRALAEVGTRSKLTGTTIDPTQGPEGLYCSLLYAPLRDFLLREGDYDWAMLGAAATISGLANAPWIFSYAYPTGALRIRNLLSASWDPTDPKPTLWNVLDIGGVRKIFTLEIIMTIWYTGSPAEDLWDPIFTESFVRFLGSGLAFALENRSETAGTLISQALSFAGAANLRDA